MDPRNRQDPRRQQEPERKGGISPIAWILAVGLGIFLLMSVLTPQAGTQITFSRFLELVEQGRVTRVTIGPETVEGTFTGDDQEQRFSATLPPEYDVNQLVQLLRGQDVEISARQPSDLNQLLLLWGIPILLLVGGFLLVRRFLRGAAGGAESSILSFRQSGAKIYERKDLRSTFKDVAGLDEVRGEVAELVDYLRRPQKFQRLGAKIPKGVLLVGPPGTGKTLLARAMAGEADVPFFSVAATQFVEMFVGAGAARVRDLFEQARKRSPAIVFIDEIDAIGQTRAGAMGQQMGGHQEREQTLQQLLSEMDGFEPNSGVIIMAATNRPDVLDKALLRPGRFDRQIVVHLPDVRGRRAILEVHAREVRLGPDVDLGVLARRTPGFSGAQLENVINEGALLAGRSGKDAVQMEDLEAAIDRVVAGLERRSQVISEEERKLVACHESGHAVVGFFVGHADPVHRVSIVPRGIGSLGHTQALPEEDRYLISEPALEDQLAVLLGGRTAERLVFGYVTSGAEDDLHKATEMARRMVTRFGMSEEIGPMSVAESESRFLAEELLQRGSLSDETEQTIDREVRRLLETAGERADRILSEHRSGLERLMHNLLDEETLERRDLERILGEGLARPA